MKIIRNQCSVSSRPPLNFDQTKFWKIRCKIFIMMQIDSMDITKYANPDREWEQNFQYWVIESACKTLLSWYTRGKHIIASNEITKDRKWGFILFPDWCSNLTIYITLKYKPLCWRLSICINNGWAAVCTKNIKPVFPTLHLILNWINLIKCNPIIAFFPSPSSYKADYLFNIKRILTGYIDVCQRQALTSK